MSPGLFSEIHLAHGKAEAHKVTHWERELRRESGPGHMLEAAEESIEPGVHEVGDLGLNSDSITYLLMTLGKFWMHHQYKVMCQGIGLLPGNMEYDKYQEEVWPQRGCKENAVMPMDRHPAKVETLTPSRRI